MTKKHKLNLPEWTKSLPDNAYMSAKEIAVFMQYKSPTCLHVAVANGNFPKCDFVCEGFEKKQHSQHNWSMRLLRKFEREQDSI
jgi:hypothetical protein